MNTKEFELIFGIISLIFSVFLGYREFKEWNIIKPDDYFQKFYSIKIIAGVIVFFMIGIAGIYRYFT